MARSTTPSGCRAAFSWYGRSLSHGKSGNATGVRRLTGRPTLPRPGSFALRRQVLDPLRVVGHLADLRRAARRPQLLEEVRVGLGVGRPLVGHVVLVVDGLDRTDRLTSTTVDAFVRVDVEHPLALVDAVHGALVDARLVEHVDAGLGDHVGHWALLESLRSAARPG